MFLYGRLINAMDVVSFLFCGVFCLSDTHCLDNYGITVLFLESPFSSLAWCSLDTLCKMLRRDIRLRREYLLRKSHEGKQKEEYEKKMKIREALACRSNTSQMRV